MNPITAAIAFLASDTALVEDLVALGRAVFDAIERRSAKASTDVAVAAVEAAADAAEAAKLQGGQ